MSMITFDLAASRRIKIDAPARKRKSLFQRFIEARQERANLELARHGLLLPRELEEAGLKISRRNEDGLPFVR